MPETPTFGFEYETPQSKPGITITGDIDGSTPILAEQIDAVLAGLDTRITANEGDISALQDVTPSDTGWLALTLALGSGFTLNSAIYRRWGPVAAIRIDLTRSGSAITANSSGNVIGDPTICTINTVAVRPDERQEAIARCSLTSGAVDINTTGAINLADLHANSSLATDDTIRVNATYFTATFS